MEKVESGTNESLLGGNQTSTVLKKRSRLESLDILRGVTIALMIFVDYCGETLPAVDHAPWDGISLADFVMPSFDFIVGVSIVMSLSAGRLQEGKSTNQKLWAALERSFKLFVLGMLTQAGTPFPTYDLQHLRIMGILQRVSLCYLVAAVTEICIPIESGDVYIIPRSMSRGLHYFYQHIDLNIRRRWHWCVALVLIGTHTAIIYGVDGGCGVGHTSPHCNAASYIDRHILGVSHMYFPTNGGSWEDKEVTFQRTSECSTCSPGRCTPPNDAPEWCGYDSLKGGHPFDPEGIVSSLTAVVASLLGAHCGAVAAEAVTKHSRIVSWFAMGVLWTVLGLVLHFGGNTLNTDLYSVSFLFLTSGVACIALCLCSYFADGPVTGAAPPTPFILRPFKWLGVNSILIYILSCSGITEAFLSCFYWGNPDHSLLSALYPTGVWWGPKEESGWVATRNDIDTDWNVIIWCVLGYIPFWMCVAGYLHKIKYYVKI